MPGISLNDMSINPDTISTGVNPVTVTYNCDIDEGSEGNVTVKLFVLSSLAVSFNIATWEDNLEVGNNVISTDRDILANSELSSDKTIRVRIHLEDKNGFISTRNTTITYNA